MPGSTPDIGALRGHALTDDLKQPAWIELSLSTTHTSTSLRFALTQGEYRTRETSVKRKLGTIHEMK